MNTPQVLDVIREVYPMYGARFRLLWLAMALSVAACDETISSVDDGPSPNSYSLISARQTPARGIEEVFDVITGAPRLMASSTGNPNPSNRDG